MSKTTPSTNPTEGEEFRKRLIEIAGSYSGYLAPGGTINRELWSAMWDQVDKEAEKLLHSERLKAEAIGIGRQVTLIEDEFKGVDKSDAFDGKFKIGYWSALRDMKLNRSDRLSEIQNELNGEKP